MSKRYKVKRFSSCYLMNWVDNKTNKELTALEIEEILHKQEKRIAELKKQLAITEKAFELACEEIGRIEAKFGSAYIRANGYLLDYFKTQAKEMLENE